ncbi:MAG: hypothetical protein FJ184_00175 [Gammaproteobacteria bacterium]|nr:hypothetical protein [Gammaproteobacteria bacterium]
MADIAREKGRTERYLPRAAWAALSPEERRATDERKKAATRGDKPVNTQVPNTEKAREARRKASEYIKRKSS